MYRLAKLFKWNDRSFDLSDEGCWFDLLDDFGPALPRFLLDDSYAASIPDGDDALDELRQSLVKQPVASLKPEIGSVWILFAFKDDLASLPPPFRRDGILLPFEWRTGEERCSELLPDALVQLAERVKGQFGTAAAGYTLHPSRHFLDTVDFKIPGATFDSAWGALATGLYLMLSGKKHLTAWPFSTIAYDFNADVPVAVGELERKFMLAASAGAEEIAVAPMQYKEGKNILATLQAKFPGNKSLKKLKIYHWKLGGDVRRSVAQLAKCNQSTKRKRIVVEMALAMCVCTLAFAACMLLYVCDWNREKVAYFRDYVNRFGVPQGLFALQKKDISSRARSYRFHFQGYDGFLPWHRKPMLRHVFCVDSHDKKVTDDFMLPLHPNIAGREFIYDESGRLSEIRHSLPNGYETAVFHISGPHNEFIDVTRRGHDGQWGTPEWGTELARGSQSDKLRRMIVKYTADGFVRQIFYLKDSKGTPTTLHGVGREMYELDEIGRVTTRNTYSCDGQRVVGNDAKGDEFRYSYRDDGELESMMILRDDKVVDKRNYEIGERELSGSPNKKYGDYGELIEENLLKSDGTVAYVVKYRHDEALKVVETAFFDSKGNRVNGPNGWSVHSIEYLRDSAGGGSQRIDRYFYCAGRRRSVDSSAFPPMSLRFLSLESLNGVCALEDMQLSNRLTEITTFDDNGHCIKVEVYGANDKKIIGGQGYHCAKYEYDRFGYRSGESYFGVGGEPVVANFEEGVRYHALRIVNNETGNVLETTVLGVDGKPMNIPSRGYARESKKYDDKNRIVECSFYDKDGKPVAPAKMNGAWRHRTIYDNTEGGGRKAISYQLNGDYLIVTLDRCGRRIQEAYYNADGTSRADKEGVASILFRYDEKGHEIKRGYFGVDGKHTLTTEFVAGIETFYSEDGDEVENRRFGVNGELKLDRNGVAIVKMAYDRQHRMIAKDFYGISTNRISNIEGDYGMRWEYDAHGNQTVSYSIDVTGKAKLDANGVGIVRYEYDARGRIVKRRFFDADGRPTKNKEGIGGWSSEFDDAGNETYRMFFDEKETPCVCGGRGGWRMRFDRHGRVIEEVSLDCRGNVAPQKLPFGGIEMKLGKVVYSYGRDGRKTVVGEAFKNEQILGEVKKVKVAYTRDGDMERIEFMNETNKLVTSSLLGYARKEIQYNEFREATEESYWNESGCPAISPPEMIHRSVIRYMRTKSGLTLDCRNYDAENFPVVGKTTGFARLLVRYDAQGRFLSQENFDEQNKPKVCGKYSKVFVEYDSNGNATTILVEGVGDNGDVEKIKIEIVGREAQCSRLNSKNEVMDRVSRKLEDIPKEFLNLGHIRYSVNSNRLPTQVVVPRE